MYVNTVFLVLFSHHYRQFRHPTSHLRAFSTNGPDNKLNRTIGCEYYGALMTANDAHIILSLRLCYGSYPCVTASLVQIAFILLIRLHLFLLLLCSPKPIWQEQTGHASMTCPKHKFCSKANNSTIKSQPVGTSRLDGFYIYKQEAVITPSPLWLLSHLQENAILRCGLRIRRCRHGRI